MLDHFKQEGKGFTFKNLILSNSYENYLSIYEPNMVNFINFCYECGNQIAILDEDY